MRVPDLDWPTDLFDDVILPANMQPQRLPLDGAEAADSLWVTMQGFWMRVPVPARDWRR
jgi:hypothetical protein